MGVNGLNSWRLSSLVFVELWSFSIRCLVGIEKRPRKGLLPPHLVIMNVHGDEIEIYSHEKRIPKIIKIHDFGTYHHVTSSPEPETLVYPIPTKSSSFRILNKNL